MTVEALPRRRITSLEVLCVVLLVALIGQRWLVGVLDVPAVRTGATVFVAVCMQALPFLVLGMLVSGAIAAFVSADALRRCDDPRETASHHLSINASGTKHECERKHSHRSWDRVPRGERHAHQLVHCASPA
jgi:hypothetical protein